MRRAIIKSGGEEFRGREAPLQNRCIAKSDIEQAKKGVEDGMRMRKAAEEEAYEVGKLLQDALQSVTISTRIVDNNVELVKTAAEDVQEAQGVN